MSTQNDPHSPVREIHALPPPPARRRYSTPVTSDSTHVAPPGDDFTSMLARSLNALTISANDNGGNNNNIDEIYEDSDYNNNSHNYRNDRENDDDQYRGLREGESETSTAPGIVAGTGLDSRSSDPGQVRSVERVRREAVEAKITAWETAEMAKINNRFKREDAVINGWESEQVMKADSNMKKVERKLEERRARAVEKMQNDVAKARRKAEEKRVAAESKRGWKVAKVIEDADLMRATGKAPSSKFSFFRFS